MAKYPYIVNKNGVWHPAGTEISEDAINTDKTTETKESQYTKTDINRMPIVELRELASANGIKVNEDTTGAELKKLLIEKFEL